MTAQQQEVSAMRMLNRNNRLARAAFAAAALGTALSIFVACGGSNATPAPTPAVKAPTAASGKAANGAVPNLPGLNSSKIQAGISKAQQARISAQKGQATQSVDDLQGVRSVAAANSEI